MKLPFYISKVLKAYFEVASEDRRALLDIELFNTDPLTCKKEYLPLLAVEAGVDIEGFSEKKQRNLIQNAINELKRAGSVSYLKNNIKADVENEVVELGEYRFRVDLMPSDVTDRFDKERLEGIKNRVEEYKNVRSLFDGLNFTLKANSKIKESCGGNSSITLNKGYFYQNKKSYKIKVLDGADTKVVLDKRYFYKEKALSQIKSFSSSISHPFSKNKLLFQSLKAEVKQLSQGISKVEIKNKIEIKTQQQFIIQGVAICRV